MSFQEFLPFETSGENNFTLTAAELIDNALDVIQVGSDGEGVEPEDYARALNALNLVMRELQAQGLHLASYRTGFLFLDAEVERYVLEDSDNVEATNRYFQTTLSADVTSPTTTIPVTDATNISVGDRLGVFKNDSNLFWATVTDITVTTSPAADITIDEAINGDADSGCDVLNYTNPLEPVSRIHYVMRRDFLTTDVPINQISRQEYEALPFKTSTPGVPSEAYYDRIIPQGELFIWSPPVNSSYIIRFWYESKIDDLKDPTDALDMDKFYLPVVVHTLALRMCSRLGISTEIYQRVKTEQQEILDNVLSYDNEVTSWSVSLNREAR